MQIGLDPPRPAGMLWALIFLGKMIMKRQIVVALAMLIAGSAQASSSAQCDVVGISDGDTITCLTAQKQQLKVRLAKIDAPEKDMPYGARAKQALSDAIYGKKVTVTPETIDRYGRTVGLISYAGRDINLQQVQIGMAWVYAQYTTDQTYFAAEKAARAARKGLWADPNPIRPSDWRHGGKKPTANPAQVTTTPSAAPIMVGQKTKPYCSQMTSCDEAKRALAAGMTHLDGDGDGVPCEKLCR